MDTVNTTEQLFGLLKPLLSAAGTSINWNYREGELYISDGARNCGIVLESSGMMKLYGSLEIDGRVDVSERQRFVDEVNAKYPILGARRRWPELPKGFWERLFGSRRQSSETIVFNHPVRLDRGITGQEIVEEINRFLGAVQFAAEAHRKRLDNLSQ